MTAYFRDSSFIVNKRSKNSKVKDYYFCNVEVVENKTDQVSAGICWAAAGASIIGYLKNWSSYKISARNVYNQVNNYFKNETAIGETKFINKMWELNDVKYEIHSGKLSYSNVIKQLKSNHPIYCTFRNRYKTETGERKTKATHAVVLCGSYNYNNKIYYVYMDCNHTDKKEYTVNLIKKTPKSFLDSDTGYKFYYMGDGRQFYNNWINAYLLK